MVTSVAQLRLEKLQRLRELQREKHRRAVEAAKRVDVFAKLGYEPNCLPRHEARKAGVAEEDLPAPCGQCPQEQFHSATEFDLLFGGSAGGGKQLSTREPVPTPAGWTTIGDLNPGDEAFGETGQVVRVEAVHPIDPAPVTYRLTFDDGTVINACADHLWLTLNIREMWIPAVTPTVAGTVRSTRQIAETLLDGRGRANHAIPVAGALQLPEVPLPIDPYVLGTRLGDSQTGDIPTIYLRASAAQRLALLQGLMDTAGTVTKTGQVKFNTARRDLAGAVYELAVSLGWKIRMREARATRTDEDGPRWVLAWAASSVVFRVPRKAARQQLVVRRSDQFRYIVGCDLVEPEPMRCITVDNPTGLYLAGRSMVPTHNTRALLMEGLKVCNRYPGIRVGAFRRTYPELEESLLAELAQVGFAKDLGCRWTGTKYNLLFPNGSIMMFRYAETLADATRRQGGQYQLLLFDERNLTPPDVCSFLESRLRSGRKEIPVLGIRSGTNPGGPGHGASKARYIVPTKYGKEICRDERNRTVRFIPSRLSDNPHVNPEYAADLQGLPAKLRAAFLDGNWDVFAGMYFSEWSHVRHVLSPIALPASWRRYNGIDWGYSNPWTVLWLAVDEDNRIWIYREIYKTQVGEVEQAKQILAAEAANEHVAVRYADDAMWAVRGDAKPISTIYAEQGVHLTPAGKGARVTGWQRVRTFLKEGAACAHHRALGWATCPMLHAFDTCENLVRTLPNLPHATTGDPEDVDSNAEDHSGDALRYAAINIGGGPEFVMLDPTAGDPEAAQQLGQFAVVPRSTDDLMWTGEDDEDTPRGKVVKSPWA